MSGPLEGFKVIECANFVTGPLAAMQLADQGADVLKVEPTAGGDAMRGLGSGRNGMGAFFASSNRSKRSLALDLSCERGRDLLIEMVRDADVFIQNFRPGVAERLGIGPDVLCVVNPRLREQGPLGRSARVRPHHPGDGRRRRGAIQRRR